MEQFTIEHDGREGEVWVHLPPNYDCNEVLPVVLGMRGGGLESIETTGLADKADGSARH